MRMRSSSPGAGSVAGILRGVRLAPEPAVVALHDDLVALATAQVGIREGYLAVGGVEDVLGNREAACYALTIALMVFLIPQARAQQPVIGDGGIVNGASFARVGLPNSAIAQGSIFAVFGTNMGPAQLVQVSSFPLPTSEGLAGTSISVTVGATTLNAIMLFTTANQVAAVLPSNTPVGTGTLTLTYNGLTSAPAPITVVQSSFGMFTLNQAGSGQAVIQNFNSQTDQPINLVSESVRPGQIITLWGTGLGPVEGDEAGQPLPGNLANLDIHVWILGREAQIQYRGRSGCCKKPGPRLPSSC